MSSLGAHLVASVDHGRLSFHPDCPRCRAERLAGTLAQDRIVTRRLQATIAVGLVALGTVAPAAARAAETDQQQEGTMPPTVSGGDPADNPNLDPGGDDTVLTTPTGPDAGPQAGGQEDSGDGAPVDLAPDQEPDQPSLDTQEPPQPAGAPQTPLAQPPASSPTPTTPQPSDTTPAQPGGTAPTPAPPTPSPAPAGPQQTTMPSTSPARGHSRKQRAERRRRSPRRTSTAPPAPTSPAPTSSVEAPVPISAAASVTRAVATPLSGPNYTVQPGDCLWSIAVRVVGMDASNGRVAREVNHLWRLNEDRIATGNPDLLNVGTVLRLR